MTDESAREERWVWRARLAAVCLLLTGLAFRQQPGQVVADTKLDLTVSPWSFLADSLHLWDPQSAFGQLQNQAYGYLWPMGPFHGVLLSAGLPAWVVQRLWWSLLLCVAFVGFWKLAQGMRIGGPWSRLAAALLYALCPRIASELTITSVEVWPMALAPWVLWPLVDRRERSWLWRIGLSAAAVAMCGGVNAVATGAVLVLPTLWFLTRRWSWRTLGAFATWLAASAVAIAWWLGPLVLLGRYSPPFVDWIESAGVTSSTASPFEALRGTSAWLGFLATPLGPEWPGGWAYVTLPVLIVVTSLVASTGLVGVGILRTGESAFLALAVIVGLGLMTLAWTGPFASVLADGVADALDGPLAALRNAHKFDVVLRIPLLLGVAVVLTRLESRSRAHHGLRSLSRLVVVAVVVSATAPSIAAGLARDQAYSAIPEYWRQTATWLDRQPGTGNVLVLPSSSFADFAWGSTKDDPLQALMKRPLVLRDAVPLGSAGATRFLDSLNESIGSGRATPGLSTTLAMAGIGFVVVRNDLRPQAQGDPAQAVHAALWASGLSVETSFGPLMADPLENADTTVGYRTQLRRQLVDVYRVPGAVSASLTPWSEVGRAFGGPEDIPRIQREVGASTFVLGSDASAAGVETPGRYVLTDGLRRREVNFGEVTDNTSPVLGADESPRQDRRVTDYVADPLAAQTTTAWDGIRSVTASTSASDVDATLRAGPSTRPAAALDGDFTTRWISGNADGGVGEWLRVELEKPAVVAQAVITFSDDPPVFGVPKTVRVTSESGERIVPTGGALGPITVTLPPGETRFVQIELLSVEGEANNAFSIAELDLTGVDAQELLQLPVPTQQPDDILLAAGLPGREGCLVLEGRTLCSPSWEQAPEGPSALVRRLTLPESGRYRMSGTVRVRPGSAVEALLARPGASATASSRLVSGVLARPDAVFDGDETTAWVASRSDFSPSMTVTLAQSSDIAGLQFIRSSSVAASAPKVVTLTFDDGSRVRGEVGEDGVLEFEARESATVRIDFGATYALTNLEPGSGVSTYVPVGFSELRVLGANGPIGPLNGGLATGAPCGYGPSLTVAGRTHPTEVRGTLSDLLEDRPLTWRTCDTGEVALPGGVSDVSAKASAEFVPDTLSLTAAAAPQSPSVPTKLEAQRPSAARLTLALPHRTEASVVSVPQNYNTGWRATLDGVQLQPVRINGWMQGWVVPGGAPAQVRAEFSPDRTYRWLLILGATLTLGLLLSTAVLLRTRRRVARWAGPPPAVAPRHAAVLGIVASGLAWFPIVSAVSIGLWMVISAGPGSARRATAIGLGALPVVAASIVAVEPWPGGRANLDSWIVQAAVLVGVGATSALAWGVRRQRRPSTHARHADDPNA
ncbi:arabinofuranan 3-O-arabinosyltransferase [Knoellia remsis]|uniref:Arabinofuranan 3-O-arabinosyltransferase n=1 Tax=Knoellia remsis TaxID=407159 RepID=A0A2T0UUK8_9MICO|nr:alpha-(1->3)-arabinofuranosyltransferase family protein [Knoellia remsis]PRY61527.1 arabinofuranan 3-O-arabinosyltransferase [Knoellia remsis]